MATTVTPAIRGDLNLRSNLTIRGNQAILDIFVILLIFDIPVTVPPHSA